jgi:Flp pilus assembly protein TadD
LVIGTRGPGVGSGGGVGLGDILNGRSTSSGPSVGDARKKIDKGDLSAYKELADAYRADGKTDDTIAAGEQYVKARPKDYDFMRTLAGDYEGQAATKRAEATAIQDELTATTGGGTFLPPGSSPLGRALGSGGRIDQELTSAADKKLTELYSSIQTAYSRAASLYGRVAAAKPGDILLQQLLAQAAYQARQNSVAIAAARQVIKRAPGTPEAKQARQLIALIKLQASQSTSR